MYRNSKVYKLTEKTQIQKDVETVVKNNVGTV